ncbi:MAG: helix-turn-helix domain-containing protein, partial [Bacteroidales bacterium]|nr:helix-turn-helix domain-containing protein [Bacteroidales bacterium]
MYTNTKKYSGRKTSFKNYGEEGLIPKSTRPRTCPNETSIRIKGRVIELRKETKLCAKKLNWRLEKEGIEVKERTIGNILKSEGLV